MLAQRDYFSPDEAAEYACIPREEFDAKAHEAGIIPFPFLGRPVYRKADIQSAMERAWQESESVATPFTPATGVRIPLGTPI